MIPYAELEGSNTGANMLDCNDHVAVYMKNCVVACLSAKQNAGEDVDVALVTNTPIEEPYKSLEQRRCAFVVGKMLRNL